MAKGDFSINVVNLERFNAQLIQLGMAAKPILKDALKAGGKIIQAAAQSHVKDGPNKKDHKPGTLRKSIKVRMSSRGGNVRAFVGTGSKDNLYSGKTFYGGFVEFGHKLGRRKLGNARRDVPAHPFMSLAVKEKRDQAGAVIIETIRAGLAREGVT